MKTLQAIVFFLVFSLIFASCSEENIDTDLYDTISLIVPENKVIEIEILALINQYRVDKGLSSLGQMNVIKAQAYTHTDYMITQAVPSHDNFFKRSEYLKKHSGAKRVSENVAYGFSSAKNLVNAWVKSEDHKKNMEGDYTHFQISAEQNENGKWYFTNMFIKK
ncbi:CAP domain-containing protein [Tenacibaculum bernardetii]|uniref:CAP domain-containing protein n=1 Tax=Tenacibaculum bernardetii TaxID=3021375 RepID=UPI0023B01C80|nr:CAP domain-containing protein [Tenacibaculum bernardetii]